jgi:hypothetical protein
MANLRRLRWFGRCFAVSARSLRDPQKQPPQKPLIGIDFHG